MFEDLVRILGIQADGAAATGALIGLAMATGALAMLAGSKLAAPALKRLTSAGDGDSARLRELVNASFEGVMIHDHTIVVDANDALLKLFGRTREEFVGKSSFTGLPPVEAARFRQLASQFKEYTLQTEIERPDGTRIPVEILARNIKGNGKTLRAVGYRDIRERLKAEAQIRHLAHHDTLTGLTNRASFNDILRLSLTKALQNGELLAVHCVDLDRFKEVNDINGHSAGDALLKEVAAILNESVRAADTVARLGGDEFAIVQTDMQSADDATNLAERLVARLSRTFHIERAEVSIGASVGVALFPGDGLDAETLLKRADMALYHAKSEGRATYRLFEAEMHARLREKRRLEADLRKAIDRHEFAMHYQPLSCARTGRILGCEALLRWHRAADKDVLPGQFISIAEETGLIVPIGEWCLREACRAASEWDEDLAVSVNLSPVQFQNCDLVELVSRTLRETGLSPHRLVLEITESALMARVDEAKKVLDRLKEMGVRCALDDFGVGYSSLSFLLELPFDIIKIDRTFVMSLPESKSSASVIDAVLGLGRSLNLQVVAEGVETESQRAFLCDRGCAQLQGFLIARPMPTEALGTFLQSHARQVLAARPRLKRA